MAITKTLLRSIVPLALTLAVGCAPAYHSYSGCRVDCKYCAPPPLPYTHYEGCVCHSSAVSQYLTVDTAPVENHRTDATD
ncbi:hypothetical protein Pan97_15530 [Bremerella volcania]|uniref:Lipoprotein n=1 Tax=Bremerella volcania TaxID=2527984 RepID=A0A518C5R4_9BACT|nr:hypothetical protein Pan97_15530 [Bremerella volcania]